MGGVGLLVLSVCANVAGLLLAKSGKRRKEMGIRVSLGATRFHIVRQLMGEYLLLAVPGCVLGAVLAERSRPTWWRCCRLRATTASSSTAQLLTVTPDWRVLGFTAAAHGLLSAGIRTGSGLAHRAGEPESRDEGRGGAGTQPARRIGSGGGPGRVLDGAAGRGPVDAADLPQSRALDPASTAPM